MEAMTEKIMDEGMVTELTLFNDEQGKLIHGVMILPNDYVSVNDSAEQIFKILKANKNLFVRGDEIVEVKSGSDGQKHLESISPQEFRSRLTRGRRRTHHYKKDADGCLVLKSRQCSLDTASVLINSLEAREVLPAIKMVVDTPILVEVDGKLEVLSNGYHDVMGGIYVTGTNDIPEIGLAEAIDDLKNLFRDFRFQKPSDLSRAIGATLTPAMRMGGLIKGHVPATIIEADQSQTGKTLLQDIIRMIYGEKPRMVTKKDGGVGSLDESIGSAILEGRPIIVLENMRGDINSQMFEAVITWGGHVPVRVPHRGEVKVSVDHITFLITSNGLVTTADLANRSNILRIRKQEAGFEFTKWPEGSILEHIQTWQPHYMGCIASVIREWVRQGRPETSESRHSFRAWARAMDWIVTELFQLPPIMDDHAEAHSRLSDPKMSWLRKVAIKISEYDKLDQELPASELFDISDMNEIDLPGQRRAYDDKQGALAIGRIMGGLFAKVDTITIDHFTINKTVHDEIVEGKYRTVKRYEFTESSHNEDSPVSPIPLCPL